MRWTSQLDRVDVLTLAAPELSGHAEVWRVVASPTWNLAFAGVPAVYPEDADNWQHEFHPLPGETLAIAVARPEPVKGATLAIDAVEIESTIGKRATNHALSLTLRSTQGGQHVVTLPIDAEVLSVSMDGAPRNLRAENGRLALPLRPGKQIARIEFRTLGEVALRSRVPQISLGAPASNLRLNMIPPQGRWILFARGPVVGPAVLYWSALAVLLLAAFGLSRLRRTPLRLRDWVLLGLGFSTFSWFALLIVVAWLFALDARQRHGAQLSDRWFVLAQVALVGLTTVALLALLSAVPQGLLGSPDMQIDGNGSTASALHWFADRSNDALPSASAISVSIWWYKLAMLAWALWLASALVGWLRWAWSCYSAGGYWRSSPKPAIPLAAAPPPMPSTTGKQNSHDDSK